MSAIADNPVWYHTLEVEPGVKTPGWFELAPVANRMPWPDVRGKRCLDVGTADGFLAFELERRGAAEVVAADIASADQWDWPERLRGPEHLEEVTWEPGRGFALAKELLGSSAERVELRVYDLTPEELGTFDVVVCGSLLLHLRDPLAALRAIRSVCAGRFLSANQVDLRLALLHRRVPAARLDGLGNGCQWWICNPAGHRRLVEAAGFDVERESRMYSIPYGEAHVPRGRSPRSIGRRALRAVVTGGDGVPHHALLARPAV
jgi:SAM-dependent methyltransferase